MSKKFKKSFFIIISMLLLATANFVVPPKALAADNNESLLPNFLQNFIRNMTRVSDETIVPFINKTGIGDVINEPMNPTSNESFLQRLKDWMAQTSQKINAFFKVDIGTGFGKIIDLFEYGFNYAIDWVKELFEEQ
ncbi:MAG TPA: hypothetical protein PLA99_02400 [Candidatus Paceibacterota bacterium]|nr:hypothetical protein [Candidatus Paceibacterota bacterium]HON21931.1 hypothetical protein [Candidatus Paceibacterota bacterium]